MRVICINSFNPHDNPVRLVRAFVIPILQIRKLIGAA